MLCNRRGTFWWLDKWQYQRYLSRVQNRQLLLLGSISDRWSEHETVWDNEVVQMLCLIGAHLYIIHGFKWILEAETSCCPSFRSLFAHSLKARQITTPICLFFWSNYRAVCGMARWSLCSNKVQWNKKNLSAEHQWSSATKGPASVFVFKWKCAERFA